MGKVGQELDAKSQLVSEICSISARSVCCIHRRHGGFSKTCFVDWYLVLGVEEDAEIGVIRKRYRRLALQLHPDKNKHPKAEIAFKIVSEAYNCLSDDEKRRVFNLERWRRFCIQCTKLSYGNSKSTADTRTFKLKPWSPSKWSKSHKILQGFKDIRDRLKEEARVIENCLRINASLRRNSPLFDSADYLFRSKSHNETRREAPVFDPSDYIGQGYPHVRKQIYKNAENFWYLRSDKIFSFEKKIGRYDFPAYDTGRSDSGMFRSKSACFR